MRQHKGAINRPVCIDELDHMHDRLLQRREATLQFAQSVPKLPKHDRRLRHFLHNSLA